MTGSQYIEIDGRAPDTTDHLVQDNDETSDAEKEVDLSFFENEEDHVKSLENESLEKKRKTKRKERRLSDADIEAIILADGESMTANAREELDLELLANDDSEVLNELELVSKLIEEDDPLKSITVEQILDR